MTTAQKAGPVVFEQESYEMLLAMKGSDPERYASTIVLACLTQELGSHAASVEWAGRHVRELQPIMDAVKASMHLPDDTNGPQEAAFIAGLMVKEMFQARSAPAAAPGRRAPTPPPAPAKPRRKKAGKSFGKNKKRK